MRIANATQAKALRRFLNVLIECSDATFISLDGAVLRDYANWKRERHTALMTSRADVLRSGIEVPDEWLLIEVPNYSFLKRQDSIAMLGSLGPAIPAAVKQIKLAIMRWEAKRGTPAVKRDRRMEARDKWIYDQCRKLTKYSTIVRKLKANQHGWSIINKEQGVRMAAIRYAAQHGRAEIPKRSRGRKPASN